MRRILLAVTSAILCAGLAGCDDSSKAPTVTAIAPADCPPVAAQPVTEPAPAPVVPRRHHRHAKSYARYETRETYSSGAQYSGQSQSYSQSYYESGAAEGYSGGYETEAQSSGERIEAAVWIDGYGRKHYGGKALASATPESPVRMKPWRGYDAKCDETEK